MTSTDIIRVIAFVVVCIIAFPAMGVWAGKAIQKKNAEGEALCHKFVPNGLYIRGFCYFPDERGGYFINGKKYSLTWIEE